MPQDHDRLGNDVLVITVRRASADTAAASTASTASAASAASAGDGVTTLVLDGELDLHGAEALAKAMDELLHHRPARPTTIAVDARGIVFMDSSGLKNLLEARRDATAAGVELRLIAASAPVVRVIDMAGLGDVFPLPDA
jgi:anti-anti-sigma factor